MPTVLQVPCVLEQELSDPLLAQQVCAVLLQHLRFRIERVHVDVRPDRREELGAVVVQALVQLRLAGGRGVRHRNDTLVALEDPHAHWLALLVYAGSCRHLEAFDAAGARLLLLRDAGSAVVADLEPQEVDALNEQIAPLSLTPLQEPDLVVLEGRRRRHQAWRDEQRRVLEEAIAAAASARELDPQLHPRPDPQPQPLHPAAALAAHLSVVLQPAQGESVRLQNGTQSVDAGSASAQLPTLPHGWLVAEVELPGLHRWGLGEGEPERLVLHDGQAQVLVQRGINGFACPVGESEPTPPSGRTLWRVDVRTAAPGTFTWSSQLDPGRTITFTLVLSPATPVPDPSA
ncbi:hypothetical protein GCM10027586_01440 [Kineococcus gypseus]|uniref:hypothetical protein n=1 Tax=Kineococcus gypseus TaxID=1637102 RepID=UPI003D7DEB1A